MPAALVQIDPPIPLETPKGRGYAHFLLDYGVEFHLLWVVFIDATGECWTFQNPEIRLQGPNPSMGRPNAPGQRLTNPWEGFKPGQGLVNPIWKVTVMPNAKQTNKTHVGKRVDMSDMGARLRVGMKKGVDGGKPLSKDGTLDKGPSGTKGKRSGQGFKK